MYSLKEVTEAAAAEPVSLEKIKKYLRLSHNADDALLVDFIPSARERCEKVTGKSLVAHDFILIADKDSSDISLPYAPIAEVEKVEGWLNEEWEELTEEDDYIVTEEEVVVSDYTRVRITYTTEAYASEELHRLMMELIQVWYDNRPDADKLQELVESRMSKYKVWQVE